MPKPDEVTVGQEPPERDDPGRSWRDEVAVYLRGVFVFGVLVTAATVFGQVWSGEGSWALLALLAFEVAGAGALVVLRARPFASAMVAVVGMSGVYLGTLLHFGPVQGAGMVLVFAMIVAVLYAGVRAGTLLLAVGLGLTVAVGMITTGVGTAPVGHFDELATWVRSAAITGFLGTFVLATLGFVVDAFERSLGRARAAQQAEAQARVEQERTAVALSRARELEAMGRLAGGVAHDFNNALTILMAHAEDLLERDLPPEVRDRVRSIDEAARAAAATTHQLLVFARGGPPREVSCDPAATLREGLKNLRRLLPENIALHLDVTDTAHVPLGAAELLQAVINLVLNARDACTDGGRVGVTVRPEGDRVLVEVSDDGVGMDAATVERLFEPFFTTKGGRGTGLGMPMVERTVSQVGGRVRVASTPGRGTRIGLDLPAVSSLDLAAPRSGPGDQPLAGRTVLVVEDDTVIQDIARASLESAGAAVVAATSAREALARLEGARRVDLLCTDGILTDGTAVPVIEAFRRRFPSAPILLCSGHVPQELEARGLLPQSRERLPKPFTGSDLVRAAARLLAPRGDDAT